MASVQNYILVQWAENTVKETEYNLNIWKTLFCNISENREIILKTYCRHAEYILICHFMVDIKKKDGSAYEPTTLASFQKSLQRYLNDEDSKRNISEKSTVFT